MTPFGAFFASSAIVMSPHDVVTVRGVGLGRVDRHRRRRLIRRSSSTSGGTRRCTQPRPGRAARSSRRGRRSVVTSSGWRRPSCLSLWFTRVRIRMTTTKTRDGDRRVADRAIAPLLLDLGLARLARELGRFPSCAGVCLRLGTAAECTGRRNPSVVRAGPPVALTAVGLLVQKFGGTLGRRPGSHPGRGRSPRPDAPGGQRRRGRGLGHGQDHRRPRPPRQRRHPPARRPRDGHAAHRGRAHLDGAAVDGGRGSRPARGELHRQPGRHRHRHRARQGQDHRGQGRPHPRGAGRRQGRDRRRLPGRLDRARHHHARPRRLRHHRGRARRRARRRRVRDLHRRRRRVHRRPAHRADRAQARPGLVRRDARDGGDRRARARAALGRVRRATTA